MLNHGGGRGRLGGTTDDSSQFIQNDDSVFVVVKTRDDGSAHNLGWGRVRGSISVSQSINQSSPVSNSKKIPTGMCVASSNPWSDSCWGFYSGVFVGIVVTGSMLMMIGSMRLRPYWLSLASLAMQ